MNRLLFSLFSFLLAAPALAQLSGNGYYRVQNYATHRYIIMVDNRSNGANVQTTSYDMNALRTWEPFDSICAEPGAVYFIESAGSEQYNLIAQGTNAYSLVGRYLHVRSAASPAGTYQAWGEAASQKVFLADSKPDPDYPDEDNGWIISNGKGTYRNWYIKPVSAAGDNFFGVHADVNAGGQWYGSLFASFPFTFASSGMTAYVVTKVDGDLAVWQEVSGKVAASTPVIIRCAAQHATSNRLNLEAANTSAPSGNLLQGVYFENSYFYKETNKDHFNATPYDSTTMRLLGVTADGKPAFVKRTDVKYIPRNKAYLTVPAGSPDVIRLVTQSEYAEELAKDVVTITARSLSRSYGDANPALSYDVVAGTPKGEPAISCDATPASPVGTYPIVLAKGTLTNRQVTLNNGTLTVTRAPLTVTAQSYTIKQNEPLPQYAATFAGFKNGESQSVLNAQPVFACDVPADKAPGVYPITVSGVQAQNYEPAYVPGTLTILQADPIVVRAADLTKVYGDALPQLSWTVTGGTLTGEPLLQCEANEGTSPGQYPITISKGMLQDYPNLQFVDGTLTVTRAPLVVTAADAQREEGSPNPQFTILYDGFRNGDDATSLTVQPVATTVADESSPAGVYDITVSGAESPNYDFTYVPGKLTVRVPTSVATVVFPRPSDVYTLTGRIIRAQAQSTAGLPRGIYIVEGRKVVVR